MDDPTARLTEDSSITEIRDVRPELFPESCRETIEKFQQLDKLSDAELDFVVSYVILQVKDFGRLSGAAKLAPPTLRERLTKLFLSKQVPITTGFPKLWDIILAQREIVNDACFLYSRGSLPTPISPCIGNDFCSEDAFPLSSGESMTLELKRLLAKWPQTHIRPFTNPEWAPIRNLPGRSTSRPTIDKWDEIISESTSDHAKIRVVEKLSIVLGDLRAGIADQLRTLTHGRLVTVYEGIMTRRLLDDVFDDLRYDRGRAGVAFLKSGVIDEPICITIPNDIPWALGDAETDNGKLIAEPDIHAFISDHLYDSLTSRLSKTMLHEFGVDITLHRIHRRIEDVEDIFLRAAGQPGAEFSFGIAIGETDGDAVGIHIFLPLRLLDSLRGRVCSSDSTSKF